MNTNDQKKEFLATANGVASSITQYLKATARATANLITDKLQIERQKQAAEQRQIQQEEQIMQFKNIMLQLQHELWGVFSHITPPPRLTKIEYVADFQPAGWKITPDGVLYAFRWNKSSAEPETLSHGYLGILKDKLNSAIFTCRQRLLNEYQMLPCPDRYHLCQEYPFILDGFQIEYVIDNPVDLVLVVRIW